MLISTSETVMCYFGTAFICIQNIARTFIMKSMDICGLMMVYTCGVLLTSPSRSTTLTIVHFVPPI